MENLRKIVEEMRENLCQRSQKVWEFGWIYGMNDDLLQISDLDVELCIQFNRLAGILEEKGLLEAEKS